VVDIEILQRLYPYSIKLASQRNLIIIFATIKERIFGNKHGILPKKKIQKEYYKK
jgi:hypothetical protein